eukprot:TRINITY_DN16344_c0_g1_i4.p1 TRINITY_DN16344_c0_g1~~TRINITY_DN16344_c0_g1_i4.p1  ORF type:complete len:410 (+),score=70.49 TRINITY_DN16344_c0_g1_i4:67-1230(+)
MSAWAAPEPQYVAPVGSYSVAALPPLPPQQPQAAVRRRHLFRVPGPAPIVPGDGGSTSSAPSSRHSRDQLHGEVGNYSYGGSAGSTVTGSNMNNMLLPPGLLSISDLDASLRDLLAPLVAEARHRRGDGAAFSPPEPVEVRGAFAAVSAVCMVQKSSASPSGFAGSAESHFQGACQALAHQGFRQCDIIVDKLGVCLRCESEESEDDQQVDFPWSSVSDVQDPRSKAGLQGCMMTLTVREPACLSEAPAGALALVLRLPDRATARRLADATLAFKAYEAQAYGLCDGAARRSQLVAVGGGPVNGVPVAAAPNVQHAAAFQAASLASLLLDERGCAYWSLADGHELLAMQHLGAAHVEAAEQQHAVLPHFTMEGSVDGDTPCCHICWC